MSASNKKHSPIKAGTLRLLTRRTMDFLLELRIFSITIIKRYPVIFDLAVVVLLSLPATVVLFGPGYFSMHDDQHIARLYLFDKALREQMSFPRWVDMLGYGYGYPLFNFYPPLIYFVAEAYHLIGFSLIDSVKLMLITTYLTGAVGLYLLGRSLYNRVSGIVAAVLGTYFTYHAVLVYVRGAFAETMGYTVLPFVLWRMVVLSRVRTLRNAVLLGIVTACLILAHPMVAFPSLIFLGFWGAYLYLSCDRSRRSRLRLLGAIGFFVGLSLSLFFWLPSLSEKQFTLVDGKLLVEQADFRLHFVCPQQLWYSPWGYGGSVAGCEDGISLQLGKLAIILFVAGTALSGYMVIKKKEISSARATLVAAGLGLVAIFFTLPSSRFMWESIGFLAYLQFPWRFLTFAGVFMSLVGASTVYFLSRALGDLPETTLFLRNFLSGSIAIAIPVLSIFIYGKYFVPQNVRLVTDTDMTTREEIMWRVSDSSFEFVPKEVSTERSPEGITRMKISRASLPPTTYTIQEGKSLVQMIEDRASNKEYILKQDTEVLFRQNTYYFPGWTAWIENPYSRQRSQLSIIPSEGLHLIQVRVPAGEHILSFRFMDTPVRGFGNFVTLLSMAGCLVILFPTKRTQKYLSKLI